MTAPIQSFPETPATLYDFLYERFGIGDYDEIAHPTPEFWKERNLGISKLKAMMKKRHISEKQIAIAGWYALRYGTPIRYYAQLFVLIPEAMRTYRTAEAVARRKNARSELDASIAEAYDQGEHEWADRMIRTSDAEAAAVLQLWKDRVHG